jgi:ABC-2 type transport system ATP-binding protein
MIRIRDLRVDYDRVCAVENLHLEVGPGEVCGLIGPNGAGKTSTMRALVGLLEPTYGEIEVAGVDLRQHPREAVRHLGFMPDNPPLYDDLLCWEFLDLFAASYGMPRPERRGAVDAMLERVGLGPKRDAPVAGLSRGMRQRLMLAKTLLPGPCVLVLDEPASGVDPQGRIELKEIIREQAAAGHAVLVSSHILAEMSEFCTSVAIMERGRLVVAGPVEAVRRRVLGAATLEIEVAGPVGPLVRALEEQASVSSVAVAGEHAARATFDGDDVAAAALLARLVAAGLPVCGFGRRREGLEELFLKVGATELA